MVKLLAAHPYLLDILGCKIATIKWGCATLLNCQRIYVTCYDTYEIIQLTIYKLKLVSVLLHMRTNSTERRLKMRKYVLRLFMSSCPRRLNLILTVLIQEIQRQQRNADTALLWQWLALPHWFHFSHFGGGGADKSGSTLNVSKLIARLPLCIMSVFSTHCPCFPDKLN